MYGYVRNVNARIDPYGLSEFVPKKLDDGSVFRGMPEENLYSPSARDIKMYESTGKMPGFSTFTDGEGVKNLKRGGKPMFSEVAEIDVSKLDSNLTAVLDSSKGHVSIMPSEDYLKAKNMTMSQALQDWHAKGDTHELSESAKKARKSH